MGVEVQVEGLTKSFGRQVIWEDVSLTLPAGEISVMLGPSGTGKSVLLKTLVGLLKPDRGSIVIDGRDITKLKEHDLYEVRKLFGVLFQDGALFGSMSLYDNIAFPLREHTKKSESEIKDIVLEKMDMVGLIGSESKLPGEISGGMRKRAGLARALVLDPEIILFDEPDSGLDPVRSAYLNQLIIDLNAAIQATFLIVTHDVNTARSVPDNIGLLYHRHLAMFGPREMLLSSEEPVVRQFLNAQRQGPIGMAEEKDADELAQEEAEGHELPPLPPIPLQLLTSEGKARPTQREPGAWCREHGVTPPPGSFESQGTAVAATTPAGPESESAPDRAQDEVPSQWRNDDQAGDTEDADSELTDAELTDAELTDSELTDSELTDSEDTDSEDTDSEDTDSEDTDSEDTDSEDTDETATTKRTRRGVRGGKKHRRRTADDVEPSPSQPLTAATPEARSADGAAAAGLDAQPAALARKSDA